MAVVTTTTAANTLVSQWERELHLVANEERVVTMNFRPATAEKIGDALYIRKISRIPATTVAVGSFDALTYVANTETRITVSPRAIHAAVQLARNTINQCLNDSELRNGYREQIIAGLNTEIDVDGANDASNLTTNVLGGAGVNMSRSLLADALQALHVSGRGQIKPNTPKYLCFHSTQLKHILAIPEITAADIRGDSETPNRSGYVWTAYGMSLSDSGNVYQSAGTTYNFVHGRRSHVIAYNERITVLPPQDFDATVKIIGYCEFGVGEVFDEEAALIQTAA